MILMLFEVGDRVVFKLDGARGIIVEAEQGIYHIIWEDHFSSWEKEEALERVKD